MSLFKQIALIVVFFQIITLGAVVYQNFHSVNEQIQNRLFSDAQDTATSLGLSISMVSDSSSHIQTMINAIFDSGYYHAIVLKDVDGNVLYEKHNPNVVYNVPQWFVEYIALDTTVAESEIISGWNRFGTIYIYNHNGHAYLQLWDILNNLLQWFFIVAVIAIGALYFLLKLIFKPLKKVQDQAEGILHNDFLENSQEPFTTELKDVTLAMNSMVYKVRYIFKKEVETLKKYRNLLYFDQEFKVPNRHHFMNLLRGHLDEKDKSAFGVVAIIKFSNTDQMKNHIGYDRFFQYFQEFLKHIKIVGDCYSSDATVARFNSASYVLLLPGRDLSKEMESIGIRLLEEINELMPIAFNTQEDNISFSIGMTRYNADTSIKTIMAHVDYALLQAELRKENSYHIYQEKNELEDLMSLGREMWVKVIAEAIIHHRFELVSQACIDNTNSSIYHKEIYTKMHLEDGKILSANFFLPIVKYANLLDDIDVYLFKTMVQKSDTNIALNISLDTIKNSTFISLIQDFAYRKSLKRNKPHIHFEINLNSIGTSIKDVVDFSKMVKRLGYSFGIDHFMFWPDSIDLIEKIAPDYLKVSVEHLISYTQEDRFNMMQSIHNIASSYGVDIIAVNVENEEHKNLLDKIDIHLTQGMYIENTKSL